MAVAVSSAALTPRFLLSIDVDNGQVIDRFGTAVLVDISGFTTLSEQLAAAGREGTEQLIATLSRIFTVLLPSSDDGGDVVKFAGDALFILFTGDNHAKHAVHAAWNMNRVLNAIGDIHLPSARARLRMSVGVHTGTFTFFITGGEQLNAVMTGADTTRVLALQSAADAGRILVSDETAGLLPEKQTGPQPETPGARRLLRAGTVRTASLMALHRAEGGERFLPKAFRVRPDLLAAEPDHRWVAIGFIEVTGVAEHPSPEDFARIDALTREVEAVLDATGVTLLDIDPAAGGYRYFVAAGAPVTLEDPEGRLLTALQRIVTTEVPMSVRAGMASGRVFAGFVGAPTRQTYTVMGDETNLAARLTARADHGTVLVTTAALERSAVHFDSEDGGELTLKGKTVTVPVARVSAAGSALPGSADASVFIGREAELVPVAGLIDQTLNGLGSVVTIVGDSGMGKTRLVEQALRDAPLPVIRVAGDRFGLGTPYRLLESLLRPLLEIAPDASPAAAGEALVIAVTGLRRTLVPWTPLLAMFVGAEVPATPAVDALDDAFRLDRAHTMLGKLLDELLPDPVCLVIDDAQWVDAASAAALRAVLAEGTPHAVVVLQRPVDGGVAPDESDAVALAGLNDEDGTALVEAVARRSILPDELAPVLARADGVPLYLTELAAALGDGREPLAIEHLVGERIDELTDAARAVIRRAAVLGWSIPETLFVRCVGPLALVEQEGIAGFLEHITDTVRFRSGLFRDVAYQQLNFQTRRELHRAAAEALSADRSLAGNATDAMLTEHYQAIEDWPRTLAAAVVAAEAADAVHARQDALEAYRVAVNAADKITPKPPERGSLWAALGRAAVTSGHVEEALAAFARARKMATDAATRATLDVDSAYALNVLGRSDEALSVLRTARRAATQSGDVGRGILGSIAITESGLHLRRGAWTEARRCASEAIELLDRVGATSDDRHRLADALRYHDIAASELEGDDAIVNLARALRLYDEAGDELSKSKVLSLQGVRAYYRCDWTTAADLYAQARDAADAAGDVVGGAIESANAAEVLIDQGRLDEAKPLVRSARRVFEASGNPYLVGFVTGFQGRAAHRAGDMAGAVAAFAASADIFDHLGETDSIVDARVRLAEAHLHLDDDAAAAAALDAAGEITASPALSRSLRVRAMLAARSGQRAGALSLADLALDAPGSTDFELALSQALAAQLHGDDTLSATARAALDRLGVVDAELLLFHSPLSPMEHSR